MLRSKRHFGRGSRKVRKQRRKMLKRKFCLFDFQLVSTPGRKQVEEVSLQVLEKA